MSKTKGLISLWEFREEIESIYNRLHLHRIVHGDIQARHVRQRVHGRASGTLGLVDFGKARVVREQVELEFEQKSLVRLLGRV